MIYINNKISVSIIIASYNCAQYLPRSIQSALNQKGCNVEVILVDDASTDATPEIAYEYEGFIKYVRLDVNTGPAHARNVAIGIAKSEWIVVLDADDWLDPCRCLSLISHANKNMLDIVADNQTLYREDDDSACVEKIFDNRLSKLSFFENIDSIDLLLLLANPSLGILQPVFKKSLLSRLCYVYSCDLKYGEDYDFLIRLVASGARLGVVNKSYYNALIRNDSLVADRVKMFSGMIDVYHRIKKDKNINIIPEVNDLLSGNIKSARRTISYGAFSSYMKNNEFIKAAACFIIYPSLILQLPGRVVSFFRKKAVGNFVK